MFKTFFFALGHNLVFFSSFSHSQVFRCFYMLFWHVACFNFTSIYIKIHVLRIFVSISKTFSQPTQIHRYKSLWNRAPQKYRSGIWKFFINWQEFEIVRASTSIITDAEIAILLPKCLANIHCEKPKPFHKFMERCSWRREKIGFFFLYPLSSRIESIYFRSIFLSFFLKYDKYVGLVKSEYWVHITRFISYILANGTTQTKQI